MTAAAMALLVALAFATVPAGAAAVAASPRYDVPAGYVRCAGARAWSGFFKWASARRASCGFAATFMRRYAGRAARGPMPRRLGAWHCRIRLWRNADGDVYASRHTCRRGAAAVRFYGMA